MPRTQSVLGASPSCTFDVICAGEASWARPSACGAARAAVALARQALRVGLATVLPDDTAGRAFLAHVAAAGVDVGGVALATLQHPLLAVERPSGVGPLVTDAPSEPSVIVPAGWTAQVLLLSGISPVLAHAAALCRAARTARRTGTLVVIDVDARWREWQGRDGRAVRMLLREADVVWCSAEDLFGLNMDFESLRAALRPGAVLAATDGAGHALATGPFGAITASADPRGDAAPIPPAGEGDAFTTAICAELARAGRTDDRTGELWSRALRRGYARASARAARA